jgi:hypothetical protein
MGDAIKNSLVITGFKQSIGVKGNATLLSQDFYTIKFPIF